MIATTCRVYSVVEIVSKIMLIEVIQSKMQACEYFNPTELEIL